MSLVTIVLSYPTFPFDSNRYYTPFFCPPSFFSKLIPIYLQSFTSSSYSQLLGTFLLQPIISLSSFYRFLREHEKNNNNKRERKKGTPMSEAFVCLFHKLSPLAYIVLIRLAVYSSFACLAGFLLDFC